MHTSATDHIKKVKEPKYPKLMIDPHDGQIILATGEFDCHYIGMSVHAGKSQSLACDVGVYRNGKMDGWAKIRFIEYNGVVTLSNSEIK